MCPRLSDKRERLLDAAKTLIHQHGFKQTTLADIAQESGVPLGNVYYYFKTKDDIAIAVIDEHVGYFRAATRELEQAEPDPRKRLMRYVKKVMSCPDEVASHGCPVGSLCQELAKEATPLARKADVVIKAQVDWAAEQFKALGKRDATDLGLELIAKLQGISLLANAMKDCEMVGRQVKRLEGWLREV